MSYTTCEICEENYDGEISRPSTCVPCGHTFCKQCIESFRSKQCPVCRVSIEQTVTNYALLRQIINSNPDVRASLNEIKRKVNDMTEVKTFFEAITKKMSTKLNEINSELAELELIGDESAINQFSVQLKDELSFNAEFLKIDEYCQTQDKNKKKDKNNVSVETNDGVDVSRNETYNKALEQVGKAIDEDKKRNHEVAIELYKEGIQLFFNTLRTGVHTERQKLLIRKKCSQLLDRVEYLSGKTYMSNSGNIRL